MFENKSIIDGSNFRIYIESIIDIEDETNGNVNTPHIDDETIENKNIIQIDDETIRSKNTT